MQPWPVPGAQAALELAASTFSKGASVLDVGGTDDSTRALASRAGIHATPVAASLPALPVPAESAEGLLCPFPTRFGPLIPMLHAFHDALAPGGLAVVSDLVWQTAPTPELIRAFAPAAGQERVRPIEGYEMQADHAGFEIVRRVDVTPGEWHPFFAADEARRAALSGDTRGAARVSVWALRRA